MNKTDPVTALPSIGKTRAALFGKLGILTVGDLLEHYPRDYDDRSNVRKLDTLSPGRQNTIRGVVRTAPEVIWRDGRSVVKLVISDDTGLLTIVWFNQPYLRKQIVKNREYVFTGKVTEDAYARSLKMENPDFECSDGHELLSSGRIVPVYSSTAGLGQKMFRKLVKTALDALSEDYPENLPENIRNGFNLCRKRDAVMNVHFPTTAEDFYAARRRLVFEELFFTQMALFRLKGRMKRRGGPKIKRDEVPRLLAALPYELTAAQNGALSDILADMESGAVMNRLIQGDVGSGKTAVAMAAAYAAISNGFQAALMAPTEVLARQHFKTISRVFGKLGIETVLLAGSLTPREKKAAREMILAGAAQMITGTHALIQENVDYRALGLVITDEQHRFGVNQRFALMSKGPAPHVMVMTATPIPRTLGLILYGDLDISVMRGKPPGRPAIDTFAVNGSYRPRIYAFLRKNFEAGRQAYVICPAIEDRGGGLNAVKQYAQSLSRELDGYVTEPLHGKMKPADKQAVMDAFAAGKIHALVSTTVIEVGIDVPNATVIIIENADRFGLAQLHQLRGRVGRGTEKSYCVLISDSNSAVSRAKLKAMAKTSDGFELSELDLQTRGPGDFFGVAQHGLPEFKIADLSRDIDILKEAQKAAVEFYETHGQDADEAEVSSVWDEADAIVTGGRGKGKGAVM